jgi:hypothetical protein
MRHKLTLKWHPLLPAFCSNVHFDKLLISHKLKIFGATESVSFSPSPFSLLADIGSLVLLSVSFSLSQDEYKPFSLA